MKFRGYEERRGEKRIDKTIPIKLFSVERYDAITETKNISASGTYCSIGREIPEMTKLQIKLRVPAVGENPPTRIDCEGVVVRTESNKEEEGYNIAIYFNNISEEDKAHIRKYVYYHLEGTD